MTFEKRLSAAAGLIESALGQLFDRGALEAGGVPERLADAMRHAVMAGGKRLRPFLVLEAAVVAGSPRERAMPAAIALELVHCYSLVHDDLPAMDNDELRRGKPTVWKAFDEWTAILAGDALMTLAFEHLASAPAGGLGDTQRLKLVAALALASGAPGMVGGQQLDLEADRLGRPERPDAVQIQRLQAMKTGRLFEFACRAGAIVADATPSVQSRLASFGALLGNAFQLADDLLDVEGDPVLVGKATAKDAAAGKATLIGLIGLEAAHTRLDEIERAALTELDGFDTSADVLREALHFACARRR